MTGVHFSGVIRGYAADLDGPESAIEEILRRNFPTSHGRNTTLRDC